MNKNPLLGELEQKVMNVMWKHNEPMKPSKVKELLKDDYAYTTVMTILTRLTEKKLLKRKAKGNTFYYAIQQSKYQFAHQKLRNFFENVIDSYKDLAITQFVDALEKNPKEIEKLEQYLRKIKKDDKSSEK